MSLSSRTGGAVVRTLLLTDLVESTRLIERLGDVRSSEILADSDRIARDLLVRFDGTEIDKTDGFLFLFERPIDAVRYALAYHTALAELESRTGASISSRAGIHLGEVVLRENAPGDVELGAKPVEVDGLAKHTAARLMSLAGAKQTLLTRGAFDLSRRGSVGETTLDEALQWLAHGQYRFKGVTEPMEIFEVGIAGFAPLAAPLDSEKASRALTPADELMLGWRPGVGLDIPHRSNWVLREKLGEGGFGEAWLVANRKTGEQRTFKFCLDAERLGTLRREVSIFRLMRELLGNRDDIVRILDWQFDEAPYFLESEWSEDGNFIEWAERQGGLDKVPLSVRLELIAQLAEALAAAHSVGVLHKDLKPTSVLIATDSNGVPKVRLTDFGVGGAKDAQLFLDMGITLYSMTDVFLPDGGSATGSPHLYNAPELIEGKEATVQTDIFALGVMLYQVAVADFSRALASGWERNITDELLREDIGSLVDGSTDRRKNNALEVADYLRRLPERRTRLDSGERTSADGDPQILTGQEAESRRRSSAAFGAAPGYNPGAGPPKPVVGGMISHYRIIEKLAEGGMGALYLAEDIRLKRRVVLKFLLARALQNSTVRERFIREARAAALLDHPNICPVFEIDEVGEGSDRQTFISMPYIQGGSLKEKLLEKPLPISDVINIIIQIGSGLARAHAHGIVHRDIKPANIMMTTEDIPKIVDFGLAMIVNPTDGMEMTALTQEGAVSGTLLYMSPEQARGTKVDHRSDIWSLGVLAYEAATGKHPFQAVAPHAFLNAMVNDHPESIASLRPEAPQELDWVVRRAMAKFPDQRYPQIEEMVSELQAIQKVGQRRGPVAAFGSTEEAPRSIAVLPFRDMSPGRDQGYFCEGIAEEIINALMQVKGLQVASRGSSFQFDKAYDVRDIGQRLKVEQVTEGSLRRSGNRLRITAQLTNTSDGYQVWSERFDRDADDIFEIQDEISMGILKKVKPDVAEDQGPVRRYTDNIEAYNLYLKGRYYWNHRVPDAIRKSIQVYKQALDLDPNYALAYCGLADCYLVPGYYGSQLPGQVMPLAKAAAERALAIDPNLVEAHTSLGMTASLYDYDWPKAEHHFGVALRDNPDYALAHMWHALFFLVPVGQLTEAVTEARRAQQLDPITSTINVVAGACLFFNREYDRAVEELERALEMDSTAVIGHYFLGRAYWECGQQDKSMEEMQKAKSIYNLPLIDGHLGYCYATEGRIEDARNLLAEMDRQSEERYIPAASRAPIHIGLGETAEAAEWLRKAYEERSFYLVWTKADPVYAALRQEPQFLSVLEKIGLA